VPIQVVNAETPPPAPPVPISAPKKAYSEQDLVDLVTRTFRAHGLNPNLGLCIAYRESQWQYDRAGLEPDGTHSDGLFQIHLVAHPEISIASATDPVFATEWTAQQIAAGNVKWWSTYHEYCDGLAVQ
jgi:hypothetical protein